MKNCTLMILALLAAAVIAPPLASALTVTISQVQSARSSIVVTLSNSNPVSKHSAESIAASAKGGIAFLICDLPAGIYSALVLAGE
jgi:uncharacterized protein (DUF2141 family)